MLAPVDGPENQFSDEADDPPAAEVAITPRSARQRLIRHPVRKPHIDQLGEGVPCPLRPRALVPAVHHRASTVSLMAVIVPVCALRTRP